MLTYDDPRWKQLLGGYRTPYDPTAALKVLESGHDDPAVWGVLWDELHHQGDVGEAAYAAMPHLVRIQKAKGSLDWNLFALVSTIEIERHRKTNPPMPVYLVAEYRAAWSGLETLALEGLREATEETAVQTMLTAVALSKGLRHTGAALSHFSEEEWLAVLDDHLDWSELYR